MEQIPTMHSETPPITPDPATLEQAKQQIDYVKHITTLSTGSTVLLAALLDKVFPKPEGKFLIVATFVFFIISIISAVVFQGLSVITPNFFREDKLNGKMQASLVICMVIMWICFLLGMISFVLFFILNLAAK
jgi:putative intracellular protease/amidase